MTKEKENELIADAALNQYTTGDCDLLYDTDILKEHGMTESQMETFLSTHSDTIDKVEERLFSKVVELVEALAENNLDCNEGE